MIVGNPTRWNEGMFENDGDIDSRAGGILLAKAVEKQYFYRDKQRKLG